MCALSNCQRDCGATNMLWGSGGWHLCLTLFMTVSTIRGVRQRGGGSIPMRRQHRRDELEEMLLLPRWLHKLCGAQQRQLAFLLEFYWMAAVVARAGVELQKTSIRYCREGYKDLHLLGNAGASMERSSLSSASDALAGYSLSVELLWVPRSSLLVESLWVPRSASSRAMILSVGSMYSSTRNTGILVSCVDMNETADGDFT